MRSAQVLAYGKPVSITEVAEPTVRDPHDVIVRIAGAGVCRTDVHILHGELEEAFHPTRSWRFPGVDGWPGGYAELLRTSARALVPLPDGTDPAPLAPHADAGLTAMHAVRRIAPFTDAGSTVVTIGSGGVGQIAIQLLRLLTPARLVVVEIDPVRAAAARRLGADLVLELPAPQAALAVRELTNGVGVGVVLDLVGEGDVPAHAMGMLAKGGVYSIVGYGGYVRIEHLDMINRELTILGNQIGTYADLVALVELVAQGKVTIDSTLFPLDAAPDVLRDVEAGRVSGRAVLVP